MVVIGAGLSGLSCAIHLLRRGVKSVLLEAKSKVGGRVASNRTETGFLVDQGFQVVLDSYPELESVVSLSSIDLQPFNSGAIIYNGRGMDLLANPFRHPLEIWKTLSFPHFNLKDISLVVSLMFYAQRVQSDESLGEASTLNFLKDFGFTDVFIESFWRPFLAGVYLDPDLTIGKDFFLFLLKCFAWGKVCLPKNGMEELPIQMSQRLPQENIRLNAEVKSWTDREVLLCNGETLEASHVVCAFDTRTALPSPATSFRSVTTHYFTSASLNHLGWDKWLILVPQRLGMNITHMALISSVASNYGHSGMPLLSVSIIGAKNCTVSQIIEEIEKIAGRELSLSWVTKTEVPRALPIIPEEPSGFKKKEGVFYCGDQYASPSINGALRSGRLVAENILKGLPKCR